MKLPYFSRTAGKRGDLTKLRREGHIPAVLYGKDTPSPQSIYVQKEEIAKFLRQIKQGMLATTLFELHDGQKSYLALIKEVQYHRSTYAIEHLDFILVNDKHPITVNVPIQIMGAADCVGVKLGGFVRQPIRSLKVSCFLKDLPQEFAIDVRDMQIAQSKRLADIVIPAGVKPKAKMNEVAVVIAKKA
ncbi:MAG TPA: 50S ribosomal protein L25 [Chlamydiales bacterium]|nr:50S ribosomal protein L25 [Chlamydiales bacterium]